MAYSTCSGMMLHLNLHGGTYASAMNSSSISVGKQEYHLLPGFTLPGRSSVHFRLNQGHALLSLRNLQPYRSAFLSERLLIERRPSLRCALSSRSQRRPCIVRAIDKSKELNEGSAQSDDLIFVASDDDDSMVKREAAQGSFEHLDLEEASSADLTVEEIEVPGLAEFSEPVSLIEDVQSDTDEGYYSVRSPPKLVQIVKSSIRYLSGAPKKEDVAIQKSSSGNIEKLWWNPLQIFGTTKPSATDSLRRKIVDGLRRAEDDFFAFSSQLGKYMIIMSATGAILATGFQLSGGEAHKDGVLWFSWLAGIVIGSMIGAGQVLESHARRGRRNVVITGSTRGLGKALAREFLRAGDNVVVASRSPKSVSSTVTELQQEVREQRRSLLLAEGSQVEGSELKVDRRGSRVVGMACDVSKSEDVQALAEMAVQELGTIDIWINNAGMNKGFRPLVEFSDEEISEIVSTNLTGSLICTREAIRVMKKQPKGGHIFNMDGAGSGGTSTPLTAVYGATKCGLKQLSASLLQECKGSRVGIHTASPGMVLTDLLLSGASLQNKKMFNIICEQPETVAQALVPNLRTVKGTGKAINYLTPPRIVLAIVNAWYRRGRWFDEEGRAVYAAEADRLRLWAEGREKSPVTAAMEMVPSGAWVSLFSSSVLCAYVILSNLSSGGNSGI